ncbi:MAG: PIN domain-containing protein [Acidobacteria bacterium]|nr:MAG: PIN domain-containing protein [Acidobacteriota bacterium]
MKPAMDLFVDTSAWFALIDKNDQNHRRAAEFLHQLSETPILFHLTDYIVDETTTLLRIKVSHRRAVAFLDYLKTGANIVRSHVSPDLLVEAENLFRRYKDKKWSLTDCVSFAYMDQEGLQDVFSFDANFREYGKQIHPGGG